MKYSIINFAIAERINKLLPKVSTPVLCGYVIKDVEGRRDSFHEKRDYKVGDLIWGEHLSNLTVGEEYIPAYTCDQVVEEIFYRYNLYISILLGKWDRWKFRYVIYEDGKVKYHTTKVFPTPFDAYESGINRILDEIQKGKL